MTKYATMEQWPRTDTTKRRSLSLFFPAIDSTTSNAINLANTRPE